MRVHGHGQVHRFAAHFLQHVAGAVKVQDKQTQHATLAVFVNALTVVEVVQHAAGLRIKAHMPNPMRIFNFTSRDNAHTGAGEVSDPAFEYAAKSVNERLSQIQTGHHVEAFASLPIAILCSVLNDIQVDTAQGNTALLEQFTQTAKATFKRMTFHCFVIGSHHGAIFQDRYFLGSEKQLCGAGF